MRLKARHAAELELPDDRARGAPADEVSSRSIAAIDEALARVTARRFVSSAEVADMLLDLRTTVLVDFALAAIFAGEVASA